MNEKIETANRLIEKINERSLQRYYLIVAGQRDLSRSWTLYVEDFKGDNRCKVADGNWYHISKIINALAEINDIAESRIY